jgi:hypothetical protein
VEQTSAGTPAPGSANEGGESDGASAGPQPGFAERGRLRRRARFLRKARELAYRDLGGLVFNLHRFGQRNDALVLAKLSTLAQIDTELRSLETSLREQQPVTVLREAGITACPRCAAIHGSEDRFCPNCGLPISRHVDLPIAGPPAAQPGSPATAQPAPPAPASAQPVPATPSTPPQPTRTWSAPSAPPEPSTPPQPTRTWSAPPAPGSPGAALPRAPTPPGRAPAPASVWPSAARPGDAPASPAPRSPTPPASKRAAPGPPPGADPEADAAAKPTPGGGGDEDEPTEIVRPGPGGA